MIYLILILGVLLRLVAINQSLWLDEAIGAVAVRDLDYSGLITSFLRSDNHPPLYYFLLKLWSGLFGYSEVSLRIPSVIFGVLTIYVVYLIARKLVSDSLTQNAITFPILTALLLATSPFHIYYSQEARMYIMAGLFASMAVFAFLFVAEKKASFFYWALFAFSITVLLFSDYVPTFLLPTFWIVGIVKKMDPKWWTKFLLAHIPLLAFGAAWFPTFWIQVEKGGWLLEKLPGWRSVAGGATVKQAILVWMKFVLGRISFADKPFYYSLIVVASIPFALGLALALKRRKKVNIIWLWLILPLALGFVASFWFPAFIYFRFLYVIPAFYLLASWGVCSAKGFFRVSLISSLLLINAVGWTAYASEPYQQREDWRGATRFVEAAAQQGDVAVFEFPEPFAPYRYYSEGKVEAIGVTNSISADKDLTAQRTKETVEGKRGVYYFEYLRDLSDPERVVEETLEQEGFSLVNVYNDFPGVGQISYYTKK